jgi:acyl-CoA synthetase (AMP-forming)/AMP-acid ligase II
MPTPTIYRSPYPDIAIPDGPLTGYVFEHSARYPDRAAFVDTASASSWTYRELLDRIHRTAGGLVAHGFRPGDVLGVMAPNSPDYAVAFHAAAVAGGTATTINPVYGPDEIAFQLRDANASMIVTATAGLDNARQAASLAGIGDVFVFGDAGSHSFDAFASADPIEQMPVGPDDTVVLPYSSGTTGLPKGVMLTHRNCAGNIAQTCEVFPFEEHDVIIAVLPFFHIYGMQVIMNSGLRVGATLVTMPRFDLVGFLEAVQDQRVTVAYLVPPIVLALAKQPIVSNYDLSSLRLVMSGAAPLGAELAAEASERIGASVIQGYGMTELSPVTHVCPVGDSRPGSIGVLLPNCEARLVDPDTGDDVSDGSSGELWLRGPMVMKGYLNNEEATAATIDAEEWLHTGDVAEVDPEGHFKIVDRVKELIKYKGFQVPPAELEALLLTHPAIADCAVIPVDDEEAGEIPKAFVVTKPDHEIDAEAVMAFVAEHVASYKQVREVEFIEEIPKSASGKILRRLLKQR